MKYKFLVLDLDGTLTNSQKEITQHTLQVLLQAQSEGIKLVLASGRPTYGITPLAEELQMNHFGGYILSFNGGKIIDTSTMEVLYQQILPHSIIATLHQAALKAGATILSYRNENIITEEPSNRYVQHEAFLTKMATMQVDNFTEAIDFSPNKCLIVGEEQQLIPLAEELNEQFSDTLSAYRSEPFFLEVVPKGIDKALSLKRLLEHENGTTDQMIAVGDGFNDLSMIQLAGLGVAMANAQEVVKQAADYITLSNDEDGVAAVVEKLLLGTL
ncbi:MAG: Cof-type HAD-IIB family hydrolase [Rikenellaceae bacterium]